MTDELEPTLQQHLRARAAGVQPQPDVDDLHRRIDDRTRARRRAVGAALALALVLGPLGGFALGRAGSGDDDATLATGGGSGATGAGNAAVGSGAGDDAGGGYAIDYAGPPLDLLGQRTTAQGLELVVRAGALTDGVEGCVPDRLVRVGVVGGQGLVGTVLAETYPPDVASPGLLRLTGLAEGRPVVVGIIRTSAGQVTARFPDGTLDTADVQDGVAVVAAFAPVLTADGLAGTSIQILDAPAGTPSAIDGSAPVPACNEPSAPPGVDPTEPKPELPAPGEQPADPAAAEAEVRAAYTGAFDNTRSQAEKSTFIERPEVWRDANQQLLDGPYGDAAQDLHAEVDAVVFTDTGHASVRFQLLTEDDRVPRYQIGDAVLVDGRWLVAITTPCGLLTLAGIHCDMSL